MKANKLYILLFACVFTLSSCHDDLNIVQTSQLSAASMWTEEGDAVAAMYGTHQRFRAAFNKGLVFWGEYRNGLWGPGNHGGLSQTDRDQIYQSTMANTNAYADWEGIYTTINMANLILKYTPGLTFANENKKNEVLANAYFIRAFSYYWIARIWGDAPLCLDGFESTAQDLFPTRTPAAQIFEQVGKDINQALALMPVSVSQRNIASPGAINMLKADYNLWMYKVRNGGATALAAAAEAVNAVLTNTSMYKLENDYAAIFDTKTESGSEVIYGWKYTLDEYTDGYPIDYQFNSATVAAKYHFNPVAVGVQQQWCFYTNAYVSVLTEVPTDTRLKTNYNVFYDDVMKQTFHWTNKYKGSWVNGTLILDADMVVYRLADAYMMDAEIKAESSISGAVASLNKIAKRAYGVDNYYPTTLSAADLKNAIVKERMKEFPAEGKLWWDFIRLGVAFEINPYLAGRQNDTNILLWPLSDDSINDNPNLGGQTDGWN